MIVHEAFWPFSGETTFYATVAEARADLREHGEGDELLDRVWLRKDLTPKRLAVQLLNGDQFVIRRERVSKT